MNLTEKKKIAGYMLTVVGVLCFTAPFWVSMDSDNASIFVVGTGVILLITSAIMLSRPLTQGTHLKSFRILALAIFIPGIIIWPTLLILTSWSKPDALAYGLTMLFRTLPIGFILWIPCSLICVRLLRMLWKNKA